MPVARPPPTKLFPEPILCAAWSILASLGPVPLLPMASHLALSLLGYRSSAWVPAPQGSWVKGQQGGAGQNGVQVAGRTLPGPTWDSGLCAGLAKWVHGSLWSAVPMGWHPPWPLPILVGLAETCVMMEVSQRDR